MANYNTTATVNLSVNGRQAQQMLKRLQGEAQQLEQKISKAALAGDKVSMAKYQKELRSVNSLIQQLQSSTKNVEQVMRGLDRATPRELQKTLRTLQTQLNGIQRGTAAWDAHVAKIQAVKAQIAQVNTQLAVTQGWWTRFNNWLNQCQTAILGLGAAIAGLIMAGRKAVNAFAEMDEQLANTRKYTGMAAEDVDKLNDAFKRMDTRTPRDKLNELAQEAGRLGKNTLESVQGYVEAADIINVALVDLGAGATQTIAKLTNIFGVEQMLGTKDAMLAVGSTVNVLSQNCTASKPYLVEFAQRMAGIGSQAGLTIPEILAFGAVLDANGQKVEMSATAIQKVIMALANKNHEFAATLGLDAEKLNATLKVSAREGLVMFLERLKEIGEQSGFNNATMSLAPAFKDMGLDAARVSQVLSTLAKHLDEVKWQFGEANKAFEEASSATNEYTIFNNTAQAAIDKAKKRVNELAIELGEKLYPIMKHIYTSSGVFLRVLSALVDFFIKYGREIVTLCSAIIAYNAILKVHALWLDRVAIKTMLAEKATKLWAVAMRAISAVSALFKVAVAGVTNAVQYFSKGLQVNYDMQQRWRKALAGLSFGGVVGVILAIASAVYLLAKNFGKADEATRKYKKSLSDCVAETNNFDSETLKEREELDRLFGELQAAKEGTEEYTKAKNTLLANYGKYLSGLVDENGRVTNLAKAYDRLAESIRLANLERGIKNSRDQVDNLYLERMNELNKGLYQTLLDYGVTVKEASMLTSKITTALNMGQEIDPKTISRINEISAGPRLADNGDSSRWAKFSANIKAMFGTRLPQPSEIVNLMYDSKTSRDVSMHQIDVAARQSHPLADLPDEMLDTALQYAKQAAENNGGTVLRILDALEGTFEMVEVPVEEAKKLYEEFSNEKGYRAGGGKGRPSSDDDSSGSGGGSFSYTPTTGAAGSASESTDKFAEEKAWREREEAIIRIAYAKGEKNYLEYTKRMDEIAVDFYDRQLKHTDLSEDERLSIESQYREAEKKQKENKVKASAEEQTAEYNRQVAEAKQLYIDGKYSQQTYDLALEQLEIEHLKAMKELYAEGTKERLQAEENLRNALMKQVQKRQQEQDQLEQKYAEMKKKYFGDNPQERKKNYDNDIAALQVVYNKEIAAAGNNAAEKLRIEEAFQKAKLALQKQYGLLSEEDTRNGMQKGIGASVEWLNSDGGKALTGALSTAVQGMSAVFSGLSSIVQAELEMQTAQIEKRYDKELSRAEGNTYKIKKLESQKEKELAKAKKDANRKMFAMQVIQAVAQTATNALNAYGSAAAVPVVGYILAPIAAAMAVAAGAIQIAAIKKQQQASEAQGYACGGYTPKGPVDREVGVVHAGEWVASQKLVNSPQAAPLIAALDYAQRNNVLGSLRADDVSRSITAPMVQASQAQSALPQIVVNTQSPQPPAVDNSEYVEVMRQLKDRLNEPFVTVNTVTGDLGIQRAQDEYSRLLNNKKPKSRK